MQAKDAIKHWAAWGRDLHHSGGMCLSIEHRYAQDPERFVWQVDKDIQAAFKYDLKTAEQAEKVLVCCLNKTELRVLVCCDVYGHNLTYPVIARRIHMPKRSLETIRMAALNKFSRCWHG